MLFCRSLAFLDSASSSICLAHSPKWQHQVYTHFRLWHLSASNSGKTPSSRFNVLNVCGSTVWLFPSLLALSLALKITQNPPPLLFHCCTWAHPGSAQLCPHCHPSQGFDLPSLAVPRGLWPLIQACIINYISHDKDL